MENVGVIGFGFLGKAFVHGFSLHANIKIYDKYDNIYDSLEDTVNLSKFIMVGVPTPMQSDGNQDLSNIDDAIKDIVRVAKKRKTIVLRSTIIPGTTGSYASKYPEHNFLFHPEFLTERSFKLDFINAARIIIGHQKSDDTCAKEFKALYRTRFPHTPIYLTTYEAAEVVKYMCNSFFAVKISFLNELYDVAKYTGISYNELRNMFLADARIGNSHVDVPGHDNQRGYGLKCLPKDIQAFIKWAESEGLKLDMCKAADKVNERVRTVKDWLDIKGATSENNY